MSKNRLHKCRVAGPCWACRHEIERGETYANLTVWAEDGPARTVRVHVDCKARIDKFTRDDWNDWAFEPCDLHWWADFADSCPRCKSKADAEWETTKHEIGLNTVEPKGGTP